MNDSVQFPCNNCGADLKYQPGTESMKCSHCGQQHHIEIKQRGAVYELDFYASLKGLKEPTTHEDNNTVVQCSNCAAAFPFQENLHADNCPYCGSNIIAETSSRRSIAPWGMLPFGISSRQAFDEYKKWLNKLWFAPNKLKKYARTHQQLNGMYVPYWTFDTNTTTQYTGKRGTYYQVPMQVQTRVNGKMVTQTRMVTKVRWTPVQGQVSLSFDDVLIYASNTLPKTVAKELEPWDLNELAHYQKEFVSGFQSEIYQVDLEHGFIETRQRISPSIHQAIRYDIGGDIQNIHHANTQYSNIRFRHILLPFWVAGFQYNRKTYQFVVNGRTGEVQGQRPYSVFKIIGFASLVISVLLIMLWLGIESGLIEEVFHQINFQSF